MLQLLRVPHLHSRYPAVHQLSGELVAGARIPGRSVAERCGGGGGARTGLTVWSYVKADPARFYSLGILRPPPGTLRPSLASRPFLVSGEPLPHVVLLGALLLYALVIMHVQVCARCCRRLLLVLNSRVPRRSPPGC